MGIRIYVLADGEIGYVYSILSYYGSLTTANLEKPELSVSSRIPLTLVKKLLNNIPSAEGYHLYTDRYFTSIPLANELLKLKVHLTGTVMPTRKYLLAAIKKNRYFHQNWLWLIRRTIHWSSHGKKSASWPYWTPAIQHPSNWLQWEHAVVMP